MRFPSALSLLCLWGRSCGTAVEGGFYPRGGWRLARKFSKTRGVGETLPEQLEGPGRGIAPRHRPAAAERGRVGEMPA